MASGENTDTQRYLDLLEQRIAVLGSLAEALTAARQDMVCLDVNGLEARIAQQQDLCWQVCALDIQLDELQTQCANRLAASGTPTCGDNQELGRLLAQTRGLMKTAQGRLKALNTSHQALLHRCRRTTRALLNSYATFADTYGDPLPVGEYSHHAAQVYSRERR